MIVPPTIPYLHLPADRIGVTPENHTLPADIRLGPVALQINDLDASLNFYTQVIGLKVHHQDHQGGQRIARLGTPNGHILLELREKKGVRYAPHRPWPLR